jgi:flagellar protein FlgJ
MTPTVFLDSSGPTLAAAPAPGSDRARLGEAARQFEAIFLRQMLAAARSTDFGGDDVFGGAGEETFRELRDARFAEIAAGTGSLGLAASIEAQLARYLGPEG